ncbi:CPBP family intramembrane metalloprotease [Candidatus Nomurabacteria bacterium]|nr:CPBP family intramembrane metalloprotease [Candidatus Nomurabacteria bacterium]
MHYKISKRLIFLQIFLIFIFPVFLLYFKILPLDWRILVLALSALFIYGIIHHEKWSHREMGVRHDNIKKSLPYYLFFTTLGVAFLFLIDYKVRMPDIDTVRFFVKTWLLFLPISFFQEFAFRSFLIPRLKLLFNNQYLIVLVNAILFTFIHIIYPNLGIGIPLAFISGLFFAWIYLRYPNLLLVFISHAILNLTAVLLGFFHI